MVAMVAFENCIQERYAPLIYCTAQTPVLSHFEDILMLIVELLRYIYFLISHRNIWFTMMYYAFTPQQSQGGRDLKLRAEILRIRVLHSLLCWFQFWPTELWTFTCHPPSFTQIQGQNWGQKFRLSSYLLRANRDVQSSFYCRLRDYKEIKYNNTNVEVFSTYLVTCSG
jgi:hypothetical protein